MRVILTGGSGFVGSYLVNKLINAGHTPIVLTRDVLKTQKKLPDSCIVVQWDPMSGELDKSFDLQEIEGADAVVNLMGESIFKRWTNKNKKRIRNSRIFGTRNLVQLLNNLLVPPKTFISASAIGYYPSNLTNQTHKFSEADAAGEDFLSCVCRAWEAEALEARNFSRVVITRLAMVLDGDGGLLKRLAPLFRSGLGGQLGDGEQSMSWIHREDLVSAIFEVIKNDDYQGVYNLVAPETVTNKQFSKILADIMGVKAALIVPEWAVKMVFGEMSELVLGSQRVAPRRLVNSGYYFKYPTLAAGLKQVFRSVSIEHKAFDRRIFRHKRSA